MTGWHTCTGLAVALPMEDIDTDQLVPARFMSTPRSAGYGQFLLNDLRLDATGAPDPAFALNRPSAKGASILVAGKNFGSGSSREAAVYALVDFGFKAVIAPGFGDIFASNAVNNGLLPALVSDDVAATLLSGLEGKACNLTIDLMSCKIELGKNSLDFSINAVWQQKLINGWDDIDLTASFADQIAEFTTKSKEEHPWVWP